MRDGIELRIPRHLGEALWRELRQSNAAREPVVFGLVSQSEASGRTLVLLRDLIIPPAMAFLPSGGHGAKWSGAYNIALLNKALEQGLGIMIFHHHPGATRVTMSQDDEQSARQLLAAFQLVAPVRPHGSVVLGETSAAGFMLMPGGAALVDDFRLRFFCETMTTFPSPELTAEDLLLYRRRPLVRGAASNSLLRDKRVAVVGLSGGGSQVATQLAGLGIGEVIGIDAQRVTPDNLAATDEFGWADILLRRRKTAAVRSRIWWIDRRVRFTAVNALVPEKATIETLKRSDIIVGCVNNLHARADLQEIAWRYCIPYVDIGLGLYPLDSEDEVSEIASISGNVFAAIPGGACLWCTGFLTEKKLQLEAGGADRSYLRTRLTARSKRDSAAYVSTFNGVLASLAVADVLQLVLGYAPALAVRKQYDGISGTVSEVLVKKDQGCPKCSSLLASGDPLWQ